MLSSNKRVSIPSYYEWSGGNISTTHDLLYLLKDLENSLYLIWSHFIEFVG
jgi:hypothetical protein